MPDSATSEIEVSLVSNKGFWLLLKNEELFVPFPGSGRPRWSRLLPSNGRLPITSTGLCLMLICL